MSIFKPNIRSNNIYEAIKALNKITDENILLQIVCYESLPSHTHSEIRKEAIKKIDSPDILKKIIKNIEDNPYDGEIKKIARLKLGDEESLIALLKTDAQDEALKRLKNMLGEGLNLKIANTLFEDILNSYEKYHKNIDRLRKDLNEKSPLFTTLEFVKCHIQTSDEFDEIRYLISDSMIIEACSELDDDSKKHIYERYGVADGKIFKTKCEAGAHIWEVIYKSENYVSWDPQDDSGGYKETTYFLKCKVCGKEKTASKLDFDSIMRRQKRLMSC